MNSFYKTTQNGSSPFVYIVEDDKGLSKLIQNKLKSIGYSTYYAYTGNEFIKNIDSKKIIFCSLIINLQI